jgi:hypothetical protein
MTPVKEVSDPEIYGSSGMIMYGNGSHAKSIF